MCDYSMEFVDQRDARSGEELRVTAFGEHTKGFASPGREDEAVCLTHGTRLQIYFVPHSLREELAILFPHAFVSATTMATFEQRDLHDPKQFHDGIVLDEIPHHHILMRRLPVGMLVEVQKLPASLASPPGESALTFHRRLVREHEREHMFA